MTSRVVLGMALGPFFFGCGGNEAPKVDSVVQQAQVEREVHVPGEMGPDGIYHAFDGRFFIRFPEEPSHAVEQVGTNGGSLHTHFFVARYSDSLACMVAYTDHPHEVAQTGGQSMLLQRAVEGALEPLGILEPQLSENIAVNGHPGLKVRASRDRIQMDAMFVMVRERLYQVSMLSMAGSPPEAIRAEFFGSLHLADEPTQPVEDWFPFEELDPAVLEMLQQQQ